MARWKLDISYISIYFHCITSIIIISYRYTKNFTKYTKYTELKISSLIIKRIPSI